MKCPCVSAHGYFCSFCSSIFFLQFSLYFGKKTFWWVREENTQAPPFTFLPLHRTKHTSKKFSFPFSLQSFPSTLFHLQTNTPIKHVYKVKSLYSKKKKVKSVEVKSFTVYYFKFSKNMLAMKQCENKNK